MKKKELGFMFSVMVFVVLVTIKIWIKQRFELQLLGLVVLIGISWGLKLLLFRKVKGNKKANKEESLKKNNEVEELPENTTTPENLEESPENKPQ